jgi:SPP1 family predicted phage head-tail adaptor
MALPQPKPFDRRVEILTPTTARDAAGGSVETYTALKTVWCRREDTGGREVRTSDSLRGEADAVFTIRWFSGLLSTMRLYCENREYDITSPPEEMGRRQFWRISASEREGQA